MPFSLKRFTELPLIVAEELQGLVGSINVFNGQEHKADGTHGDITADSLTLSDVPVGTLVDLPYEPARFTGDLGAWDVDAVDFQYLRACAVGQFVTVWFGLSGTGDGTFNNTLYISLPEYHITPTIYDDGGGLNYQGYTGGAYYFSDAIGSGVGIVRAQQNPVTGNPTQLLLSKPDSSGFDGSDNDYRGFCTFLITPGNVPFQYNT